MIICQKCDSRAVLHSCNVFFSTYSHFRSKLQLPCVSLSESLSSKPAHRYEVPHIFIFSRPSYVFFSSQPIDMRSLISATAPLICFSPEALVHWWVLSSLLSSLESPPWLFSITGAHTHFYLSTVKTKGRALSEKISKLWIFTNGGFPFWKLLLY